MVSGRATSAAGRSGWKDGGKYLKEGDSAPGHPSRHSGVIHRVKPRDVRLNIDNRRAVDSVQPLDFQYVTAAFQQLNGGLAQRIGAVRRAAGKNAHRCNILGVPGVDFHWGRPVRLVYEVNDDDVGEFIQVVQCLGKSRVGYDFGNNTHGVMLPAFFYLAADGADGSEFYIR